MPCLKSWSSPDADFIHTLFTLTHFWHERSQLSRNELIRLRFAAGETLTALADAFDISPQRVYQIVHRKNK